MWPGGPGTHSESGSSAPAGVRTGHLSITLKLKQMGHNGSCKLGSCLFFSFYNNSNMAGVVTITSTMVTC